MGKGGDETKVKTQQSLEMNGNGPAAYFVDSWLAICPVFCRREESRQSEPVHVCSLILGERDFSYVYLFSSSAVLFP